MKPILPLIEQLSDGSQIDWDRCVEQHPELDQDVEGLRRLAQVTGAFRQCVHGDHEAMVSGFSWGHMQAIELIGEGSFGLVYRAYDELLDRDVALKLRRDDRATLASTQAFIAEARRLAQVRHRNVLAVHGAGVHDNRVGLWTDLLSGQTLSKRVRDRGQVAPDEAVLIVEDVLRGLNAIHSAGLIHGDVKASNIMIEPNGRAVLMDFGAGIDPRQDDAATLLVQGSPLCMAPELLDGAPVSRAADIYSVGVLLHYMLTGGYPVNGENIEELRAAHGAGRQQSRRPSSTPSALGRLLDRLLDPGRDRRPTAEAALGSLLWLKARPARRKRRIIIATVIGSLALALSASLIALQRVSAARGEALAQFQRAEQERQRAVAVKDFVVEGVRSAAPMQHDGVGSLLGLYRGMAKRVTELSQFPEARAGMEFAIGRGLYDYGDHQAGLELAERGVASMASLPAIEHRLRVESLESLASLYRQAMRLDDAEKTIRQALSLAETGSDDPQFKQAVALRARNLLANVLGDRGELVESLHWHQRVLADRTKLLGPDEPRLAANHNNIGRKFESLERWPEALASFRQAESLLLRGGEEASIKMALVRAGIAQSMIGLGQWDQGQVLFTQVRQRYLQDYPPSHAYVRAADLALADLLRMRGQPALALDELDRLLIGNEDRVHLYYRLIRARVAIELDEWADAERSYRQALQDHLQENKLYRPFLNAALAWTGARAKGSAAPRLAVLLGVKEQMQRAGLEHSVEFAMLSGWVDGAQSGR